MGTRDIQSFDSWRDFHFTKGIAAIHSLITHQGTWFSHQQKWDWILQADWYTQITLSLVLWGNSGTQFHLLSRVNKQLSTYLTHQWHQLLWVFKDSVHCCFIAGNGGQASTSVWWAIVPKRDHQGNQRKLKGMCKCFPRQYHWGIPVWHVRYYPLGQLHFPGQWEHYRPWLFYHWIHQQGNHSNSAFYLIPM